MKKSIENQLYKIAAMNSHEVENRGDLEYRNSDAEDCINVSVGDIKAMLEQAFELGRKSAELERKQNSDFKDEIFRQAFDNYERQNGGAR